MFTSFNFPRGSTMKSRLMIAVLAVVASVAGYVWFAWGDSETELAVQQRMIRRAARGTADDPIARERWEFDRLKDPATGRIPRGIRAKELAFASSLPTKESIVGAALAKGEKAAAFTWVKRGPHNVGGRTRAFAIDVTDINVLLAGGVSGGMWRSTDDGVSWTKTTGSSDIHSVSTIAQDTRATKQATWYYGTGEGSGNSASGSGAFFNGAGIFKSTTSGVSWSVLGSTVGASTGGPIDSYFDIVYRVATDPSNPVDDELYAATILGVHRSTNGGTSWTTGVLGAFVNAGSYFTDVAVTLTGVVYAALSAEALDATMNGNDKGIWRSTDGVTWTLISNGVTGFPTAYGRIVIGLAPSNPSAVYFLIEGTDASTNHIDGHQIWKYTYGSGDGSGAGGTWVNKGGSLPNEAGATGNSVFSTQGGYDMDVHVKPDDENYVIVGGVNLYRTANFSITTPTWTRIGGYATAANYSPYTNQHADQHSGIFRPGSNIIYYAGHDGGISKTADVTATPVVWSFLNNGYVTTQFYTIAIDRGTSGNNVVIGGTQDNGTWFTTNTTTTSAWVSLFSGDGAYAAIANGRTYYYVSSQNSNMYRLTLDGNGNWVTWANIQPTGGANYSFINPFVLDPNNTNMMYLAGGDRVWRNSDLTAITAGVDVTTTTNWTEFMNAVLPLSANGERVTSLGVSKGGTANRLYIGSNAASVYRIDGANTGSPTLSDISGTGFPVSGTVGCVAVNPDNADQLIAVFTNYSIASLFYTTNGGTSWTDVGGNLEAANGPSCRWGAIVPTTQSTTYFAATSTGLYSTTTLNAGSTVWALEGSTTIGNVVVDMIDFRQSDGLVVAATHGNGVYSTNVIVSAPPVLPTVPTSFALTQNFPNPFNPSTTIQYDLPERATVKLSVFDMAGREIALLVNTEQDAGRHEARWNARDSRGNSVASGTYFYRLTAAGKDNSVKFSRTEKMTYVK